LPATYDLNSVDLGSMPANRAHFVDHREGHGEALFAKVSELDFEGIVAK
jgi:ATP-dependent DNA ligase